jgi:hypothetical protein
VEATLEGVDAAKGQNLKLDSEGGAQVTTPKTRYLTTGIAVMLAASSVAPDEDRDGGGGSMGGGAARGASGFKLVGTIVAAFAHSRVVTSGFGFYGAGMSVYSHFLARGRDVVYPKDMSMVIDLGTRENKRAADGVVSRRIGKRRRRVEANDNKFKAKRACGPRPVRHLSLHELFGGGSSSNLFNGIFLRSRPATSTR